ncbi:RNA polymerase sigma factor [Hoeflea prorocentri]|uniref:RNA polymerase sigma factor n=1 Tax=Hoeflea prorocentri TaxID=1922333 RepID=A0A9X3ZHC8_9HYPH|nr:RNA polymerase sigma factor [Hoeflea prorocentri]MCY6381194.1 RNA polymerase sigma factor [Hoeflea prorocentri]MDA5398994.1 RNA polymerase sigma factor [Hoeflea prorocentri]
MADEFGQQLIALLPNLRRFAISICRSRDIADDLVQTTCEKALANRGSYQPGTRMDAWLFRILRNSWIDRTRRQKTEGPTTDIDDAHFLVGQDGAAVTEARLMLDETARCIAALPDDQREVLILVSVEGLSYKEAAEVLELPMGTVMSRLARARKKIMGEMGIDGVTTRSEDRKGLSK